MAVVPIFFLGFPYNNNSLKFVVEIDATVRLRSTSTTNTAEMAIIAAHSVQS